MAFLIGVIHQKQVEIARSKGVVAFSKGRAAAVRNLNIGDKVVFYSPRSDFEGDPVRCFTGHATVTGDSAYEIDFMPGARGFVRDAAFDDVTEVPVKPMLEDLSFIKNPSHWGMAFRMGKFSIPEGDYRLIAQAMGVK